jgi:hypothetical protein
MVGRRLRRAGEDVAAEHERVPQRKLSVGPGVAHRMVPGDRLIPEVAQDAGVAGADLVLRQAARSGWVPNGRSIGA